MPLPVQPPLPQPGPYGTQVDDALAYKLTNTAWTNVGFPQDALIWSNATEAAAVVIQGSNDQTKIVTVGTLPAGANSRAVIGKLGYRWMRLATAPTGVVQVSSENYLVPGTTLSTGLRSSVDEDPLNPFRYLLNAEASEVDWGDGTVDSETEHTYLEEGFYWVSVKGQSEEGEEATATHLIQVGGSPDHRALTEVVLNAAADQGLAVTVGDTKHGVFGVPALDASGRDFGEAAEEEANPGSEEAVPDEGAEYTREELEALTNAELSEILASQGKASTGTKTELVDRILA